MTTVFADTFYYVALLCSRDEHHLSARKITEEFEGAMVTTAWVITEVANFMSHAASRAAFLALLDDLKHDDRVQIIPPTQNLFDRSLELYTNRPDKDWSLTDCQWGHQWGQSVRSGLDI